MGFRYSVEVQTLPNGQANFYVFDRDANQGAGKAVPSLGAFGTFDCALEMAESMEDTSGRPEREIRKVGCLGCGRSWYTGKPAPVCDNCQSAVVAPIIDVEETVIEDFEIDPRGTIYWGDGSRVQWTRTVNGRVFHFSWCAPSDWFNEPACVTVWSHPYGNVYDSSDVRKITLNNPTRPMECNDCGHRWESYYFKGHAGYCTRFNSADPDDKPCHSRNIREVLHDLAA